jgi:hypothetical protein
MLSYDIVGNSVIGYVLPAIPLLTTIEIVVGYDIGGN